MPFDAFIGNSSAATRLRGKLRQGRFPHGLIFSGPEGIGKRTFALMLARALNCPELGPSDFCGLCTHCRKIDAGVHPDVTYVTLEEESSEIKIAQIRQVLHTLDLRPLEGANKIFIIDPAEAMNAASANALLKGLEEPPESSYFILLTANVHELLLTVRSRSQVYHFAPLTVSEVLRHGVADELAARWSQGSIGRARSMDVTELKEHRRLVLGFLETAVRAGESEFRDMIAASGDLSRARNEFTGHLSVLTVLLADLLYIRTGLHGRVVNVDIENRLETLSAELPIERLVALGECVRFIESAMKNYVNRQMLTDVLALTASASAEKILNDIPGKSR
jgi:DNA polymerase-3 subunit delta'